MTYSLRATISMRLDVREQSDTSTSPAAGEGGNQKTYNEYSDDLALSGETVSFPEIGGEAIDLSHTLSGGATKDFNLTAAPWAGDVTKTVDKTGKKLVGFKLKFAKTNDAAGVAFGPQGANGYALFGAGLVPKFFPGAKVMLILADEDQVSLTVNTPAVAAGAKDLRFTGTDGDSWECVAIFTK